MFIPLEVVKKTKTQKLSKIGIEPTHLTLLEEHSFNECLIEYQGKKYIVRAQFNNLLLQANGFSITPN